MKNTIKVMVAAIVAIMLNCFAAFAADASAIGAAGALAPIAGNAAYEASVISRTVGRAGSSTINGAKGIIHEIEFVDKMNAKNLFNSSKTMLTKNSTAPQVDVVTVDNGKVIARYQLKDTPSASGIRDTVSRAGNGDYSAAQMIGTEETVEAYTKEAAKENVSKAMKSSKISTKQTEKLANMKLNNNVGSAFAQNIAMGAGVGGAVGAGVALIESVVNQEDVYEATGNVVTEGAKSAVAGALGGAAGTAVTVGLAAAGTTGFVATAAPVVGTIVVGGAAAYGLNKAADHFEVKERIADGTEEAAEAVGDAFEDVKNTSEKLVADAGATIEDAKNNTVNAYNSVVEAATNVVSR